jgi:hypothetical protein
MNVRYQVVFEFIGWYLWDYFGFNFMVINYYGLVYDFDNWFIYCLND